MIDPTSDSNRLGELAEDFLDRRGRGERPTVVEYAEKYPISPTRSARSSRP